MRRMTDVIVTRRQNGDPMRFDVGVREGDATTQYAVTVSEGDIERLGAGRSPEAFVRACFAFLLEREPKESIPSSFDVGVTARYFPEFEREIAER